MEINSRNLSRYLYLSAIQGAAAWSAYAIGEFIASSVLFRLVRPYSVFTPWHWRMTALLMAGYLMTGIVAGAAAGLAVNLLARATNVIRNSDTSQVLESATTFSLALCFGLNMLESSGDLSVKGPMLAVDLVMLVLLAAAIQSSEWSRRLGFLTNPWVVAGLLLGCGEATQVIQLVGFGKESGAKLVLWSRMLAVALAVLAAGSIFLGRWLRPRLKKDRPMQLGLSWPSLAVAVVLMTFCFVLGGVARAEPEASSSPAPGNATQPNIIIVVLDTVRADHLSLYGYNRDTTPNMKKLAKDSVVYKEAIAPSDMTLSSHASLFTGLYAGWHGAHCAPPEAAYGRELAPGVQTLAEMLSSKGYTTLGSAANLYLRAEFGLQRGFKTFRLGRPVPVLGADETWYLLRHAMRRGLSFLVDTAQFDRLYNESEEINREFLDLLGKRPAGKPFFGFLNYMDAHFPYIPPAPYDHLFPGKNARMTQEKLQDIQARVINGEDMPEADLAHCVSQYDGGIAYMDAQVGRLVDSLKQRGLYDSTMIVVTADHGEAFGEKHLVLHGNSAYQNLIHVGLLIKYPNSAQKGVVESPVSLIDIAPTILNVAGYEVPKRMQSRSLLDPATTEPRELFSESFACPVPQPKDCTGICTSKAAFAWPNKLITSSTGRYEVYNLSKDPDENRNLGGHTEVGRNLGMELSRWVRAIPAQAQQQLKLDSEGLRRLKSLGYVQGTQH
jgi:arylsulfatase A-like enzyme